ncbi:hypothetical protein E8E15_003952 [Penicillium rubens]|jgi:hypothetical protein|nr:uncharacterized protein N7525_002186 [Penicillium rubens]KAJ5278308.1 hypothetical protein N7524_004461 [Penicillium chrysogenum]KAF3019922.1 hypothetical protein E8E15_003952 [Penicillium rubens]KAJ5033902.1 hypothetical protein NUH16_005320 [Penicillium rubens]KAJ5844445.1 hypothetical protein N7525_002186 [Penicillium rubens]KZN84620.1 hypothetical protein EN45_087610 [Penicillium chrysogenum]
MESPAEAYPVPVVGEDEDQPGFWAHSALNNPWPRGRRVRERPGTLLHTLQTAPLRREPGLRTLKNGEDFYYTIGTKTANIEALLVQSVGERIDIREACDFCQLSQGPFTSCVIAAGLRHLLLTCANCHWGSKGKQCSFITQPPIAHTAIPQTATPEMPDMSEMPKTLKELDETLAKEILARDSVMALLHDHDRRIEELVATKAIMQASEQEHC